LRQLSLVFVVAGVLAALFGVSAEQWKVFIVGIVFLFGSGVFATLHLGSRDRID